MNADAEVEQNLSDEKRVAEHVKRERREDIAAVQMPVEGNNERRRNRRVHEEERGYQDHELGKGGARVDQTGCWQTDQLGPDAEDASLPIHMLHELLLHECLQLHARAFSRRSQPFWAGSVLDRRRKRVARQIRVRNAPVRRAAGVRWRMHVDAEPPGRRAPVPARVLVGHDAPQPHRLHVGHEAKVV